MIFHIENKWNPFNIDDVNVIRVVQNSDNKDEDYYMNILTWLLGRDMRQNLLDWNVIIIPQYSTPHIVYHAKRSSWLCYTIFLGP